MDDESVVPSDNGEDIEYVDDELIEELDYDEDDDFKTMKESEIADDD